MAKKVQFYDPHPGYLNPMFPGIVTLPLPMKEAAESLEGKVLPLEDAVKKLCAVANKVDGEIKVLEGCILLKMEYADGTKQVYGLIKYSQIEP